MQTAMRKVVLVVLLLACAVCAQDGRLQESNAGIGRFTHQTGKCGEPSA